MNATVLLSIATLALVIGPLIARVGRPLPAVAGLVDGATVGGILVVSLLHLMPEAGAHLGPWALAWFALGLVLPTLAERLLAGSTHGLKLTIGALVVVLFLAHEVIESAALASKASDERLSLATLLVVVGHRLPVGILLWGQTRKRFGVSWSIALVALVAAATWFGPQLVPTGQGQFSAALSALLAGGLLHLVLQHAPEHGSPQEARAQSLWSAIGCVAAAIGLFAFLSGPGHPEAHEHGVALLPERLRELGLESALPVLVGLTGAALIEAFLPASAALWLSRGSRLRQALGGVAIGTPLPVCSCGVLPIYRSLISRGVAPAAGLALLVAAPEIGLDSLVLSWRMLGGPTTLARLICALLLALAIGWIVGGMAEKVGLRGGSGPIEQREPLAPLPAIRRAFLETWGHLAPWILFGLLAAALVEPWISSEWARRTPPWVQILALTLAGMPTYICATAATPLAALLLTKGFAPGAVIAFLLTGPATNLTTFGAIGRLHSGRVALGFVLTALVTTVLLALAVNELLDPTAAARAAAIGEHEHSAWDVGAAFVLAGLSLWVLVRTGPRAFFAQLWPEGSEKRHALEHGEHPAGPAETAAAASRG